MEKLSENDLFHEYLRRRDGDDLDKSVHRLNNIIAPQIDCTACGGCCQQLMINVTPEETITLSGKLEVSQAQFKEKYIEESLQGKLVMNAIPCTFLSEKKCTIYTDRFKECREFPHLHKSNFKGRLFGILIHYAMCPIIFNVVEELKNEIEFVNAGI